MSINGNKFRRTIWLIIVLLILPFMQKNSHAIMGEDIEKPLPEFSRDGDTITARLIPRAKNTSVVFTFRVSGGELKDVQGIDFMSAKTTDVDVKEFKSAMFAVQVDSLTPGASSEIVITSSFFNISTEYWTYNTNSTPKWRNSSVNPEKISDDGTYQFVLQVADGGPMDSDGAVNGSIMFTGGPRDPFWSYALGTLMIRFFGIFLVLSVLMIGMLAAGKIFVSFDRKKSGEKPVLTVVPSSAKKPAAPKKAAVSGKTASPSPVESDVAAAIACAIHLSGIGEPVPDQDTMAAIATALHLHLTGHNTMNSADSSKNAPASWVHYGREAIQNARLQVFQRPVNRM